MKIVQCETCSSFIIPSSETTVDWCGCGLCCTWWRIAFKGLLSVWHAKGSGFCSVVGLNNRFWNVMISESGILSVSDVFKDMNAVCVRVRPGAVPDVKFEEPKHLVNWETSKEGIMFRLEQREKPFVPRSGGGRPIGSFLMGKKKRK